MNTPSAHAAFTRGAQALAQEPGHALQVPDHEGDVADALDRQT